MDGGGAHVGVQCRWALSAGARLAALPCLFRKQPLALHGRAVGRLRVGQEVRELFEEVVVVAEEARHL